VPILKAGLSHNGLALIDVISPCVTFNDHEGSTKSYKFTREHEVEISAADFVPLRREITAPETESDVSVVAMHDGSTVRFRKTADSYDPTDREQAYAHVRACQLRHEVATGLLFIDESGQDMHTMARTVTQPLVDVPFADLCPGNAALQSLMERYR
jgi:2-oxoglutarate ferredoxin oxidoreductase subunit beta